MALNASNVTAGDIAPFTIIAYVLIQTNAGEAFTVAQHLADESWYWPSEAESFEQVRAIVRWTGVLTTFSEVFAIVRAKDPAALSHLVIDNVQHIQGVNDAALTPSASTHVVGDYYPSPTAMVGHP